jgi:F-type H+-transporting ATPase subunit b
MRIDWWTLGLQTINVLVLIWLLARFLFRPVADIVANRQHEANKVLDDAAAARQQAICARGEADEARAAIAAERDRLMTEARKQALAEKSALLAQSSQEIAKSRSEAEAVVARERAAADEAIMSRASELSVEIAQRLLSRFPPNVALSMFIEGLCGELRRLPTGQRKSLASEADHPVEIVSAASLSEEEERSIRDALEAAVGSALVLTFRSDPGLIAGIELRSRTSIIRNSWRADLDRIREELARVGTKT